MLKSSRLYPGDTVALVNPAGMPPERFRRYIPFLNEYLLAEGFETKTYLAPETACPEELAQMFMSAWADKDVKAVFPICGSDKLYDVIPHLQPNVLKAHPVIFCGSSALSALSLWITQNIDMVTFFGPHIPFIQTRSPQRETEFSIQSFWNMLMWKNGRVKRIGAVHERHHFFRVDPMAETALLSNIYERHDLISDSRRRDVIFSSQHSGELEGKVTYITLGSLLEMVRRDIILPLDGHVLFTETMDWRFEEVLEALFEIGQHPCIQKIQGLCIAALTERTDRLVKVFPELQDEERLKDLCLNISRGLGIPVWYGFPVGHCAYKLTVPQSIDSRVNMQTGTVFLKERPLV